MGVALLVTLVPAMPLLDEASGRHGQPGPQRVGRAEAGKFPYVLLHKLIAAATGIDRKTIRKQRLANRRRVDVGGGWEFLRCARLPD